MKQIVSQSRFAVERLDGALRFKAEDGWIDLAVLEGGRAQIWCGTFNGTDPTVFGGRLWHLLKDVLPEAGIRVVAYEDIADPFVEQILIGAGFTKDGTRRAWGDGGQDIVVYSILASEVVYEVSDADGNGQARTASESLDSGDESAPD